MDYLIAFGVATVLIGGVFVLFYFACQVEYEDVAARPLPPSEWPAVVDLPAAPAEPALVVPVSPTLHHLDEGRVPGVVVARAVAPGPRHAAIGYATGHGRAPRHALPESGASSSTAVLVLPAAAFRADANDGRRHLRPDWRKQNDTRVLVWSQM